MDSPFVVHPARPEDAAAMARMLVRSWQETYRGMMRDAVPDDPGLIDAVVQSDESVALWVADPNPRAQAFYRKHGFVPDGAEQVQDQVREIRMVRPPRKT